MDDELRKALRILNIQPTSLSYEVCKIAKAKYYFLDEILIFQSQAMSDLSEAVKRYRLNMITADKLNGFRKLVGDFELAPDGVPSVSELDKLQAFSSEGFERLMEAREDLEWATDSLFEECERSIRSKANVQGPERTMQELAGEVYGRYRRLWAVAKEACNTGQFVGHVCDHVDNFNNP